MNRSERRRACRRGTEHDFQPIDVAVPRMPDHPVPSWVRLHVRTDLDPELDVTTVRGIPCTTVERTIVDCGETMEVEDLVEMLRRASRMGILDVAKLEDTIRRVEHPRATATATQALEFWRRGSDL